MLIKISKGLIKYSKYFTKGTYMLYIYEYRLFTNIVDSEFFFISVMFRKNRVLC